MTQTERVREFNPQTGELEIELPLCPSDNRLHRSARFGVHPSPEYAAWLERCDQWLRETLGAWEPDRERWWEVTIDVHLGTTGGDAPNRQKAVLDLLAGAYVTQKGEVGADGLPVSAGLVLRRGALFDDDRRVERLKVTLRAVNVKQPYLSVFARPAEAPLDEKAAEKARKAAERTAAKQQRVSRRGKAASDG